MKASALALLILLCSQSLKTEDHQQQNVTAIPQTDNSTSAEQMEHSMAIVYSLVSVGTVSVLTNALIIHVVRVNPHMHTSTNYLIVNMACGDLMATIITIPFASYTLANVHKERNWVTDLDPSVNWITCRLKRYFFFVSMFCSIFSLVAITFDRFKAVVRPLNRTRGSKLNKMIIPMVWLTSLMLPLHQLLSTTLTLKENGRYICKAVGSITDAYLFVILGYAMPHAVMITLYLAIAIVLYRRRVPGEPHPSNTKHCSAAKQTANKVTRMIICILLAFDLCWGPLFLLYIGPYLKTDYQSLYNMQSKMISKILMTFNGVSNALIYATFNQKFRRAFKVALHHESLVSAFKIVHNRSRESILTSTLPTEKSPVTVVAIQTTGT